MQPELAGRAWARQSGGVQVDIAVVGAGGAGLSLLTQLDARLNSGLEGRLNFGHTSRPSIALIDPVHRGGTDRTWCFWDAGHSDLEPAVHRSWTRAQVIDVWGIGHRLDLAPLRYVMVRSADFYALADDAAARLGAVRVPVPADDVTSGALRAGGEQIRAKWIFDSRPAEPVRSANTALLQHFRGWTVRCDADVFDPDVPILMDFSVPQPPRGVAFGYVLASTPRQALVEYTEFSRARLPDAGYDQALHAYLQQLLTRLGHPGARYQIDAVEDGTIPMNDAVYQRRAAAGVYRLGTAGGATRGSTGYTFAAMQRQARVVADAIVAGTDPMPPPAYPRRHRWLDAVLLRALDRGLVSGPELFVRLFTRNPAQRLLRFLDGETSVGEELAVMRSAPIWPMFRAAIGDAAARFARRVRRVSRFSSDRK